MLKRLTPLRRHVRSFSSSSSPPSPPTFYDDLSLYLKRVVDRSGQLTRYSEHSVFPPSNWTLSNYLLYAQLQLPSKTEIDAVEFLTGARFACDRVIRAMHSQELIDYAADNAPRPQQADEIEKMFDPTCYQRLFLPRVRRLGVGVSSLQLTELDFTGVYLSGVHHARQPQGGEDSTLSGGGDHRPEAEGEAAEGRGQTQRHGGGLRPERHQAQAAGEQRQLWRPAGRDRRGATAAGRAVPHDADGGGGAGQDGREGGGDHGRQDDAELRVAGHGARGRGLAHCKDEPNGASGASNEGGLDGTDLENGGQVRCSVLLMR